MALRPASRLLAVVAAATLAVTGLSACRSDPSVAAYAAGQKHTVAEVDAIMNELRDLVRPDQFGEITNETVRILVIGDVARDYASKHNITIPAANLESFATQNQLPKEKRFTAEAAEFAAALQAVQQTAKPVAPSEADQRAVLAHAVDAQGQPVTDSFETVKQFLGQDAIGTQVGFRDLLAGAIKDANVAINPRYQVSAYQIQFDIGQVRSFLEVPLVRAAPVVDESTAAPAA